MISRRASDRLLGPRYLMASRRALRYGRALISNTDRHRSQFRVPQPAFSFTGESNRLVTFPSSLEEPRIPREG